MWYGIKSMAPRADHLFVAILVALLVGLPLLAMSRHPSELVEGYPRELTLINKCVYALSIAMGVTMGLGLILDPNNYSLNPGNRFIAPSTQAVPQGDPNNSQIIHVMAHPEDRLLYLSNRLIDLANRLLNIIARN
jgi:hypothetical protein